MTHLPQLPQQPPKKKLTGCLTCLIIAGAGFFVALCLILAIPPLLRSIGVFGRKASYVYQLAPDPVASAQVSQAFTERSIQGVRVYVIPIKDKETQGAFIILDASAGYTGLSPLDDQDEVFFALLQDLSERNRSENLRISHVTVEYRDDQGNAMLSFTVDQQDVEKYADGTITREAFFKEVHFNLLETLQQLGLQEMLEEIQK